LASRDSLRTGAVLPLSHQDIGPWPFVRHPWEFALPYHPDKKAFTKTFIGDRALLAATDVPFTFAFVGSDLRKVSAGTDTRVWDRDGKNIGHVLTCATDVGIGHHDGRIYSITSPGKPESFQPKGLSCGFLRVEKELHPGEAVELVDRRRKISVKITGDIRPHRTARRPILEFM
jgi:aminomethyltransferase